jgi:hypothetical protein
MSIEFQRSYGDTYQVPGEGLYVARFLDNTSIINLSNFIHKMGITRLSPEDANNLHCTIVYSRAARPDDLIGPIQSPVKAHLIGFEHWPGHDGSGYLVAKLESSGLQAIHRYWISMGCEHSFPEYSPHITLKHPCSEFNYDADASIRAANELMRKPLMIRLLSDQLFEMKD